MKKFQKFLVLSATLVGAWMLFGNADQAHAVVTIVPPGCAHEATNYTVTVNWTEPSNPSYGMYVDISTFPDFRYVWNTIVSPGSFSKTSVPAGFVDSPDDGNVNPSSSLGLVAGATYYVRIYNGTHYPNITPGISFTVPECAPPGAPTFSGLPACFIDTGFSGFNINWAAGGGANPAYGFYVDISDNGFASPGGRWWTKNVGAVGSTPAVAGFNGYSVVTGPMGNLAAGVNYSVRIFNGEHSTITPLSRPACPVPSCINTGPNDFTVPYGVNTHTVYVNTINSTVVDFALFPPAAGPIWSAGTQTSPGNYAVTFNLASYPYGNFRVDVYMQNTYYGAPGKGCSFHPDFTREAPVLPSCSGGATPDTFVTYETSGMHTVTASGVHPSTTSVRMFIWDTWGGQTDDMLEYRPTTAPYAVTKLDATTWSLTFNYGAHPQLGQVNVHVYLDNPMGVGWCDTADFQRVLRPKPTITSVTKSTAAPCIDPSATYTATVNWIGMPRPDTGFYVDGGTDPSLDDFWNKNVPPGTLSTQAGTGFTPYVDVSGALNLVADANYYFRVYNDSHSDIYGPVSIPRCGNLKVEVSQTGGSWTLTGPSGLIKNGTGAQTFSPAACAGNAYYCIPVGIYTMTPTPNSPAGYNGTPAPASVTAN